MPTTPDDADADADGPTSDGDGDDGDPDAGTADADAAQDATPATADAPRRRSSAMRTAVVVGAGVGGLAAAGALARAGWQVTLLERGDRLRGAGGAALLIWPNGVAALRRARASAVGWTHRLPDGRPVASAGPTGGGWSRPTPSAARPPGTRWWCTPTTCTTR